MSRSARHTRGFARHDPGHERSRYRGVYAVGHSAITREARWKASTLAARAPLSHRAAAALWGVRDSQAVEVTVSRTRSCRAESVVHRLPLRDDEVTEREGIPVTTITRTLFDVAAGLPMHQFERAVNEAEYQRIRDLLSLGDLVARYPHRPGAKAVRRLLEQNAVGTTMTATTSRPPSSPSSTRVIVELDGYAAHGTRRAFERDRASARALTVAGWRHVRVTPRQLDDELEADLGALLTGP